MKDDELNDIIEERTTADHFVRLFDSTRRRGNTRALLQGAVALGDQVDVVVFDRQHLQDVKRQLRSIPGSLRVGVVPLQSAGTYLIGRDAPVLMDLYTALGVVDDTRRNLISTARALRSSRLLRRGIVQRLRQVLTVADGNVNDSNVPDAVVTKVARLQKKVVEQQDLLKRWTLWAHTPGGTDAEAARLEAALEATPEWLFPSQEQIDAEEWKTDE